MKDKRYLFRLGHFIDILLKMNKVSLSGETINDVLSCQG